MKTTLLKLSRWQIVISIYLFVVKNGWVKSGMGIILPINMGKHHPKEETILPINMGNQSP